MTSEIKVDTISEQTSANGVTIDGLTIKDGNIIGDVALAGTTPTFTIGDAGAEDAALIFDGNALDYYIALDDSADNLIIGSGSTVGSNSLITIDSDGDFTLDSAGDIILDADGAQVIFKDAGTTIGGFNNSSSDLNVFAHVQDKDIVFTGDDGGTTITALTLDMSAAGAATFNAGFTAQAASTITVTDNSDTLTLKSTDADENSGPRIALTRDSSSPAVNDFMGLISFNGEDSGSNVTRYAYAVAQATNVTDGSEEGKFVIHTMVGGTERQRISIAGAETIFNEDSVDIDFRVESDGDVNCFKVDAGLDTVIMGASGEYSGTGAKLTVTPQIDVGDTSLTGTSAIHFIRAASTGVIGGIYGKWAGYGDGGYIKFNADNVGGGGQTASITMGTTLNNSTADRFNIAGNGDLTATDTSIGSISDQRLKENIADFNYDISKFKQLKPRSYKWKNPIYHGNKVDENGDALTSYGTIAQEVAAVDADYVRDYEIKDEVNLDKNLLDADNVAKTTTITGKEHAMYISVIQQLITRIETLEG